MKEEQYKFLSEYFVSTKNRSNIIKALHDVLPAIIMVSYPVQLLYLMFTTGFKNETFLKVTLVPLGVLIIVTALRYIVNAKRPYEVYDYTPAVAKSTKGKSFPSRHTASAFIIAMAFLYLDISLGVIMLILSTVIGITRVLSGVHFIKDVIGGALISIIIGLICFFIL
ncbi:MAG: phosphatase PAP2 family protein [Ruminococcus sp.]|nr:phosphatase PAP2 family protein [Ruminococcus sp.]